MRNKLGRKPVIWGPRLHFAKYANRSTIKLPDTKPLNIGYSNVVPGMLCNGPDLLNPPEIPYGIGCCFWAAAVRAAFARGVSIGKYQGHSLTEPWAVASVIEGYTGGAGFNINDPSNTDNGTDPDKGFAYLQKVGVKMPDGTYDKLGTPVAVNPRDWEEVLIAHNLFGGLYVGVQFPGDWEDAPIWDVSSSPIEGGHEICSLSDVGIDPAGIQIDTWGMSRIITPAALAQFCDQLTCVVDPAFFDPTSGKAINGFDAEQLRADEAALT
ncbi:MAG TPA: hypothetical protein VMU16_04280 [Candidatus Binataceae bacterium]|nr:hypothetical protein [Candidatus Binataceae bacterium]